MQYLLNYSIKNVIAVEPIVAWGDDDSKTINDISRIKKIEIYLKSEINKYIKDEITKKKLENKVDLHINHLEENLLGGNIC